jgi:type VI protein secretion system component Hcp
MADGGVRFFFLNLQPAGVDGGSTKSGHEHWLELDSWSFSMNQTAEPNAKGGRPMTTSATGTFGFTINHNGPILFKNVATGNYIAGPITFEAERGGVQQGSATGVKATTTYLRLIFSNVVIAGRSLSGDQGQKTEQIDLSFEKASLGYAQIINGTAQSMVTKTYDVKSNQVS